MSWPILVLYSLAAVGAVGVFLMLVAFVLIARQGGWQKAIQQPIAEGRWPLTRRLLLVGPILGMFSMVGLIILRMIPVEVSSSGPSAAGETSIDQAPPVISQPDEVRTRPRDGGQPTE